jgi:serine/threonine protein kinase
MPTSEPRPLSPEAESRIARFESAWLAGNPPNLAAALNGYQNADRAGLLREFTHIDLEFRLKQGEEARTEDYLTLFPELAHDAAAISELIGAEVKLRLRLGHPPVPGELEIRFPHLARGTRDTGSSSLGQTNPHDFTAPNSQNLHEAPLSHLPGSGPIRRFAGYRILDKLGSGGMGIVFRALDTLLNREIALKVLRREWLADPVARVRFLCEAEFQAAIEHDNIVPIYQIGEDAGIPFIAMPLLKGESLESWFRAGKPMSLSTSILIARQVSEGLAAAHAAGLIHRDVKPSNIWLEFDAPGVFRRARLLDFGLARREGGQADLSGFGVAVGTPAYMAPEQIRGDVCLRSDLFSLGCVLYQLVTGQRPFQGHDAMAVVAAIVADPPTLSQSLNPTIPNELAALVERLLSKDPCGRLTATEVSAELRRIASAIAENDSAAITPPPTPAALKPGSHSVGNRLDCQAEPQTVTEGRCAESILTSTTTNLTPTLAASVLRNVNGLIISIKNKDGTETCIEVPADALVTITYQGI